MSRIFWDANVFIYLLEDYGPLSQQVALMRRRMLERGDQLLTSALAVGEVTVKAQRSGDLELARQYEEAMITTAVVLPFGIEEARIFARLRADSAVKVHPADAIHLACAAVARADVFVTNDRALHSLRVQGIRSISPVERTWAEV